MPKEAIVQIRMDNETKEAVEKLYRDLDTSFAEAVRIFAAQSVKEHGFPFVPRNYKIVDRTAKGILSKYASEKLRNKEDNAFMEAMKAKHE
jgi:addiction module RelB/DinJ family antitoxin